MNFKVALLATCLSLSLPVANPVFAQNTNLERISEQKKLVSGLRSEIEGNVATTKQLITDLQSGNLSDSDEAVSLLFEAVEMDVRAVLDSIALDSELRDSLDDMRAEIDTEISRNMREPESARRNRRLEQLQGSRETFQQQYDGVGDLEQNLIQKLVDLNREKRDTILDARADRIGLVVESLAELIGNLEQMVDGIGVVSESDTSSPELGQ